MLLNILLLLLAPILLASCVRFHWGAQHRLEMITNTGVIRDVQEILEYETGLMNFYAVDFENCADRDLAVVLLQVHNAGGNISESAAIYLPPSFEVCEEHSLTTTDVDVDEDGVYFAHLATCEICKTVHDLEEVNHYTQEPDYSKEDLMEARQFLDGREVEGGI